MDSTYVIAALRLWLGTDPLRVSSAKADIWPHDGSGKVDARMNARLEFPGDVKAEIWADHDRQKIAGIVSRKYEVPCAQVETEDAISESPFWTPFSVFEFLLAGLDSLLTIFAISSFFFSTRPHACRLFTSLHLQLRKSLSVISHPSWLARTSPLRPCPALLPYRQSLTRPCPISFARPSDATDVRTRIPLHLHPGQEEREDAV